MHFPIFYSIEDEEEARKAKADRLAMWHLKFLWWPTEIGPDDCRWLETVYRRQLPYKPNTPIWQYMTYGQ